MTLYAVACRYQKCLAVTVSLAEPSIFNNRDDIISQIRLVSAFAVFNNTN